MAQEQPLIDKILKNTSYIFRMSGMNVDRRSKTASENFKYKCWYYFCFLWLNTDLAGAVCWFIKGAKDGENLTTLTYVAPCITLSFLANLKSLSIYIYGDQLSQLVSVLRDLDTKQNREKNVEKDKIIEKDEKRLNLVLKTFGFFNWALLVAFPLMPLVTMVIAYVKTNVLKLLLPFFIVYPFDAYDIKYWPFVLFHQLGSDMIVIFQVAGADYLFYLLSTCICIQFRLLQYDFEGLINSGNSNGKVFEDAVLKTKLADLIERHQVLYNSVQHLEIIYTKSTLYNFISSSFLICLSGFNVTTIDDTAFIISFLSFLFVSFIQIYFLCYFGDMMMRSSIAVSDAVYSCKWYLTEGSFSQKLHFIQIRAQKPCKITALGFADVNLRSFTKILSTAWSYFALLKTLYASPQI